jgi:hypothetical protein
MSDAAQLAQWRAQLAREEEEDSEDENVGGYGVDDVQQPQDMDLGLALEDMPPPRIPAADASRMPRRAGQAPPGPGRQLPPQLESSDLDGAPTDPPHVLMHKLQVLQLRLEEREIELDAARSAQAAAPPPPGAPDAREAKMKELARRAKAATMALGRERAKAAQLSAELTSLKKDAAAAAAGGGSGGGPASAGGPSAAARLESASARLHEARDGLDAAALERELKDTKARRAERRAVARHRKRSAACARPLPDAC